MNVLENLGINLWGVLLYVINFGVLMLVIAKYLYKPMVKFLDERQKVISDNIQQAEILKTSFQEEFQKKEEETREIVGQMEVEVRKIKSQAEEQARQLLESAENQKEQILQDARLEIEKAKENLHREVQAELMEKIQRTINLVLKRKVPESAVDESIKEAFREIIKS